MLNLLSILSLKSVRIFLISVIRPVFRSSISKSMGFEPEEIVAAFIATRLREETLANSTNMLWAMDPRHNRYIVVQLYIIVRNHLSNHRSSESVPSLRFRSAIGFQSAIGTLVSTSQILPPFHPLRSPVPPKLIPDLRISFWTSTFCCSETWASELQKA